MSAQPRPSEQLRRMLRTGRGDSTTVRALASEVVANGGRLNLEEATGVLLAMARASNERTLDSYPRGVERLVERWKAEVTGPPPTGPELELLRAALRTLPAAAYSEPAHQVAVCGADALDALLELRGLGVAREGLDRLIEQTRESMQARRAAAAEPGLSSL